MYGSSNNNQVYNKIKSKIIYNYSLSGTITVRLSLDIRLHFILDDEWDKFSLG